MKITFYGVRGSIPVPGPGTVRYGGNTGCVLVELGGGEIIMIDCGTGARPLGLAMHRGPFAEGTGKATLLLSHPHCDHLQGFPFFRPFYVTGNHFTIYGGAPTPAQLESILEAQMAAQHFPLQTFRNMAATIDVAALQPGQALSIGNARVRAHVNPHGEHGSVAFRIEEGGRSLAYATDVGYPDDGPSPEALQLYREADLLIHDASYRREDQPPRDLRGLSSVDDAVAAAVAAGAKRLALYHYSDRYRDPDIDDLVAHARALCAGRGTPEIIGAAEGLSITL